MSWWGIIKTEPNLYAVYFQFQLARDNLTAYQIEWSRGASDREYYEEILGNFDINSNFLLIAPYPGTGMTMEERGIRAENLYENMTEIQAIENLSPKQKLDLVRQSPDTYCFIKTEDSGPNYFSPNTTFRYVLGNRRIFDRAVDALENSKEQVREMEE